MPHTVFPRPEALTGPWSPGGGPLPGTDRQVNFGMCLALVWLGLASAVSYEDGDVVGALGW